MPPRARATGSGPRPLALADVQPFAERLRVLGHPVRLLILDRLQSGGAMPVHRLVTALATAATTGTGHREPGVQKPGAPLSAAVAAAALSQAALSQHLARMRLAGLLTAQRHGREVRYAVADPHAFTILNCIQTKLRQA